MSSDTTSGPDEDFGGPTPGGEYDVTTPEQDRQAEVDAILDSLPLFGGSGGAPDFRPLKIGDHAGMLVMMDPAAARAAAQAWGKVATQYESTEQTLRGYGETLKDGWRSEASKPFMGYVGGSLSSLQEWAAEARTNQTRLDRLGDAIETAKIEMEALYQSYKSEVAEIDKDTFGPTLFGIDKDADDMQEMVDEKTAQSLIIMERLAGVLTGTVIQDGPKWAGPKGFTPPKLSGAAPGAPGGGAPQAPGGGGGAAPAAPAAPGGARPQAPSRPRPQAPGKTALWAEVVNPTAARGPAPTAPRPPAPAAPRGPAPVAPVAPTAPQAPAPVAPRGPAPVAPVAPTAPSASALGPPPAAPVIGSAGAPSAGLGGSRGAPPAAPNMGTGGTSMSRGPAPAAPGSPPASPMSSARSGLQGRNAPAAPGAMPPGGGGRGMGPQIPGRSGPPGTPGMPPGGPGARGRPGAPGMGMPPGGRGMGGPGRPGGTPGAPTLPGRQAPRPAGAKPGGSMSPPGSGVPRPLQGTRGNPSGRPLHGRGPIRPGSPASTGMPGLRGRTGPARAGHAETAHSTRAALRRGLDGRGMSTVQSGPATVPPTGPSARPANAAPAKRREEDQATAAKQIVGDEELFVVDQAAPAVIERKQEKVHAKRPGPALGR